MAMRQEQFDALVQRLENFARQQPGIYKLRVGLLAVLGYAYIFLVLAVFEDPPRPSPKLPFLAF